VKANPKVTEGAVEVNPLRLYDLWQLEDVNVELEKILTAEHIDTQKLLSISYVLKDSFAMNTTGDMQVSTVKIAVRVKIKS
jgi:hypothetical protein